MTLITTSTLAYCKSPETSRMRKFTVRAASCTLLLSTQEEHILSIYEPPHLFLTKLKHTIIHYLLLGALSRLELAT